MEPDIRDPEVIQLWRHRPGELDATICVGIAFACIVSVVVALLGEHLLWDNYGPRHPAAWQHMLGAVVLGSVAIAALAPVEQLSRFLRVAIALPIAHAIAMLLVWICWAPRVLALPRFYITSIFLEVLPIPLVAGGGALLLIAIGSLISRRERMHAFVMLALWTLLLVGLWLPIASMVWCRVTHFTGDTNFPHPDRLIVLVLVPPLVLGTLLTALAIRLPATFALWRQRIAIGIGILLAAAVATRLGKIDPYYIVYANFVHVLLALGFVAIGSLAALGVTTWWRGRRARRQLAAGIAGMLVLDDDATDIAGCFEITSWLRGPRALLQPFTLVTKTGSIVVHGGAELVVPVPATTTQLLVGEALGVLRHRDQVIVAGLEHATDGDPYRGSSAALGSGRVIVGSSDQHYGLAHVALTLWRPCFAYLMILIAIGVPAMIAAFSFT